jgi:hypothetical protein
VPPAGDGGLRGEGLQGGVFRAVGDAVDGEQVVHVAFVDGSSAALELGYARVRDPQGLARLVA